MNENLVACEFFVNHGLGLGGLDMGSSQVSVINSSIKSERNKLGLSIDFGNAYHGCVEAMMGFIRPS